MAREVGLHCGNCSRQTLHRQQAPNHVLHFLLGVLTCSLWWWVWLFLVAQDRPWLCTFCGAPATIPRQGTSAEPSDSAQRRALSPNVTRVIVGTLAAFLVGLGVLAVYSVRSEQGLQRRIEEGHRAQEARIREKWQQEGRRTVGSVSSTATTDQRRPIESEVSVSKGSGNRAHDLLASQPEASRDETLTALLKQSGENCDFVERTFFQGFDKSANASWNVACRNGRAYSVTVYSDTSGSTKVLDCAVLKALAAVECFKKF
jgi:hypothetical protein